MGNSVPDLCNDVPKKSKNAYHNKNTKELPPILGAHFGFDVVHGIQPGVGVRRSGIWWEAACGLISLHHGVLLIPSLSQPGVELVVVVQRYVVNMEAAPIEVDRLWRPALEVGA